MLSLKSEFEMSFLPALQFLGSCFILRRIHLSLAGSEDPVCSQGNKGRRHITAAQAGVEQRVPSAAKSRVRESHYLLQSLLLH